MLALIGRLIWLAALLAAEWLPISVFVATRRGGQSLARALVAFLPLFFIFGYYRARGAFPRILGEMEKTSVAWRLFAAHFCAMAVFVSISLIPAAGYDAALEIAVTATWFAAGFLAIALAGCAWIPARVWRLFVHATGYVWIFAAAGAAAAWGLASVLWNVWDSASWEPPIGLTFGLTEFLLKPFLPNLVADRATMAIGTNRFAVTVGGACSGLEGAGLMLVFSLAWLWFFRRECRFPHALLLVPAGVGVMWLMNGVRLAALILIGNAGFARVAMGGFHSQAGWLSFNLVAIGLAVAAPRIQWWRLGPAPVSRAGGENPTAAYLVPFLAILAAGMMARAATDGFEWLYPLRLFAGAGALWYYRRAYAKLEWSCGWPAALAGILVFGLWIWLEPARGGRDVFSQTLASASGLRSSSWIVLRALTAVAAVPMAEELVFRGYLIRRLMSARFDIMSARSVSWLALLGSSLAFGMLHGERWIGGTAAGLIYGLAFVRRGRMGDAVVAHAVTNLLLAAEVLMQAKWYLWA